MRREIALALARITGAGLSSIALLVAILWGCILGEHLIVQRANRDMTQALTAIRALQLKKRVQPAAAPAPGWKPPVVRPAIG